MALLADVEDQVAARDEVAHEVMGLRDVRTGGVDDVQAALAGALFDQRRNAVGGEDNGAFAHLLEDRGAVGAVECRYAKRREFFHGEAVMNDQPDDVDWAGNRWVLRRLARQLHRVHDPVAVATWSDLNDIHRNNSAFHLGRTS